MAQSGARILVVDDEPAIVRAVVTNLAKHGYRVESATSGKDALQQQQAFRPEAILLDLGLPDVDGTEVIRQIRKDSDTPIIVLSVRGSEKEKVAALDLGADDYLTKPFGVDELLARIRVALRHSARPDAGADPVARAGDIELNLDQHRVFVRGEEVHLTPTEFELLRALIAHPGKLLTDHMLLQTVWGPEYGDEAHYLHVYIARLRRKIESDPRQPRYVVTEPGVGYRLATDD